MLLPGVGTWRFTYYLFICHCGESFPLLNKEGRTGQDRIDSYIFGWRVRGRGGEGVKVFHLLFVDDNSAFCASNENELTYFIDCSCGLKLFLC